MEVVRTEENKIHLDMVQIRAGQRVQRPQDTKQAALVKQRENLRNVLIQMGFDAAGVIENSYKYLIALVDLRRAHLSHALYLPLENIQLDEVEVIDHEEHVEHNFGAGNPRR